MSAKKEHQDVTFQSFKGRDDVTALLERARAKIERLGIERICVTEQTEELFRLTICGLWRVERTSDNQVRALYLDLADEAWKPVSDLRAIPEIPFYPVHSNRGTKFAINLYETAWNKVMEHEGLSRLPDVPGLVVVGYYKAIESVPKYEKPSFELFADHMRERWRFFDSGARSLRSAIFKQLLDTDVMRVCLVTGWSGLSFQRYLAFAQHRDSALKVAREHPNLIPLLDAIAPKQWGRDDLFSRKLWLRGDRRRTALDGSAFRNTAPWKTESPARSLDSKAAWRWLLHASPILVRAWVNSTNNSAATIEVLARADVKARVPVIAVKYLIERTSRIDQLPVEVGARVVGLFLTHVAQLWVHEGHKAVREYIAELEKRNDHWRGHLMVPVRDVVDYLLGQGIADGQPDKLTTWHSLARRSVDWHHAMALESQLAKKGANRSWVSALGPTEIRGHQFEPLTTTRMLVEEGVALHHCIGSYDKWCASGDYRAFKVTAPDGTRSTIGLSVRRKGAVSVSVEQHHGKYNGSVEKATREAGQELASAYEAVLNRVINKKKVA